MEGPSARTGTVSIAGIVALAGAIAAVVGIFLDWVTVTSVSFEGPLVGEPFVGVADLLDLSGVPTGDIDASFAGRADWTGLVAGLAGLAAAVAALLVALMPDARSRRPVAVVTTAGGVAALAMAMQAYGDLDRIAEAELIGPAAQQARDLIPGPVLIYLGGLIDQVVEQLKGMMSVAADPATGLYVTGAGGLIAALGGAGAFWRAVVPEAGRPRIRGPLGRAVARLDPDDRAELLRVLTAPDETRSEALRGFYGRPGKGSWAPILTELQGDDRARRAIVAALRAHEGA